MMAVAAARLDSGAGRRAHCPLASLPRISAGIALPSPPPTANVATRSRRRTRRDRRDASASAGAQLLDTKVISLEAAKKMAAAAEAEARRNGWTVAVAVVDVSGGLILFHRLDRVQTASLDIAIAKARTAARFRRPTKALEDAVAGGRMAILSFEGVVAVEGGLPIVVGDDVIGAIGVSGMTSQQDGVVAKAGADVVTP
jgi:glc operon protein GlcG